MGQGQVSLSRFSPSCSSSFVESVIPPEDLSLQSCWLLLEWGAVGPGVASQPTRWTERERDVWIIEVQEGVVGELHSVSPAGSTFNHSGRTITDSCPTQQTARKFMEWENTRALQLKDRRITQSELNWWIDLPSNSLNWMLDSLIYWHYNMW